MSQNEDGVNVEEVRARIASLEAADPQRTSAELAEAYLDMWGHHALRAIRGIGETQDEFDRSFQWYEKAIAIWENGGHAYDLALNLTNLGASYLRAERYDLAVERTGRGLELTEKLKRPSVEELVGAFNQHGGALLMAEKLEEAEAVLRRGLSIIDNSDPLSSHLMHTLAQVYRGQSVASPERAGELVSQAERLEEQYARLNPTGSCSI